MNNQLKSKTNWFGLAVVVLGILQTNFQEIAVYLGDHAGIVNSIIGASIILLRQITTKPIAEK